jgi:PIN like domain
MRILIDEDTAVQLIDPLRHLLVGHDVAHVAGLSWKGKKDRHVLPDAKKAGYQMLITRDRAQFADPRECDAIKKSGLHHVRYAQRDGMRGLALAIGGIIAAMPMLVHELQDTDGQRIVLIKPIDPRRRYEITDPKRVAPSPYWPR